MKFRTAAYLFSALLFSVVADSSQAGGIYKWVDKQGTVHYAEQPPPQGAEEIRIHDSSPGDSGGTGARHTAPGDLKARRDKMIQVLEGDRLARQEKKQQQQKQQQQRIMECARAKDTLRQYLSSNSLYRLGADGKRHSLPESARQQKIHKLQTEIKQKCK